MQRSQKEGLIIQVMALKRKENSKAVPLCHAGAKVERSCSSYSSLTSTLDGVSCECQAPGRGHTVSTGQEAGWASELVWRHKLEEKSFASAGDRTHVVQSVVRHYTAWATPAPNKATSLQNNWQQHTAM
jgi:hypothetical protein